MAYYFRMMTERNTICIGQRLYRTEVSRSTEVAAPSVMVYVLTLVLLITKGRTNVTMSMSTTNRIFHQ